MKIIDIRGLLRPHLREFKPYSSARTEYTGTDAIFLDANENPLGSSSGESYHRYPNPLQTKIKQKVAALRHVLKEQVFIGNGSDEAIDLLYRAFCEPGLDNVIVCPPTYGMYETSARLNNVTLKQVLLTTDFQLDVKSVIEAIDANTKMIFICSPNNPTGNLLYSEDIKMILKSFGGLVVIDEAYIDFADADSWVNMLDKYPNLVVLQTLSKAWGMAGIRVGMAFASSDIIDILTAIKPPYNVSSPAQQAALKALTNETTMRMMVADILEQRHRLSVALLRFAFVQKVYPSDSNSLLVKVDDADGLYHFLVEKKIIIRNRNKTPLCEGCVRITVGSKQENDALLQGMDEYTAKN
jgi:histidinol-phosphate aminotransferase